MLTIYIVLYTPHLEHEVRRRARLDCLSEDAVVVRVDQRLVQVKHHHLPPNQTFKREDHVTLSLRSQFNKY